MVANPAIESHQPKFYEWSLDVVIPNVPLVCPIRGVGLTGTDPEPYRHQSLELPKLRPQITEHQLHQLTCKD
ncbi:MAG: hypothetical protein HC934_09365 [Acaryochloridaceae cyanobacterium SU_2_1]|nr:hypothetical protein [Acaryochloridaceae cyanobacterium SU_2_1]NJN39163.1 hypothetical protein [Acaryochloridaceae cyanobacterium CSU_3_4]